MKWKILFTCVFFCGIITAQTWQIQNSNVTVNLNSVCFTDSLNGIVVGEWRTILKTENGGTTWNKIPCPINIPLKKIIMMNKRNGIAFGSGYVIRTTDGGNNWVIQLRDTSFNFYNLYFLNESVGWVCGIQANSDYGGVIYKTTDTGITWTKQLETMKIPGSRLMGYRIDDIFFFDNNNGIAIGNTSFDALGPSHIIKTDDGGENWYFYSETSWHIVRHFSKMSKDTIWAGSFSTEVSTDRGKTWTVGGDKYIGTSTRIEHTVYNMIQENGKKGYLVSYANKKNRLLLVENIFNGFKDVSIPTGTSPIACTKNGKNTVWVVGEKGLIMKSDGVETKVDDPDINSEYKLCQNYPNPFNPATNISYSLSQKSNVKLVVYDLLGREVTTLVNTEKSPGNYTAAFDASFAAGGLASGIYFYNLTTAQGTISKKMLLVK